MSNACHVHKELRLFFSTRAAVRLFSPMNPEWSYLRGGKPKKALFEICNSSCTEKTSPSRKWLLERRSLSRVIMAAPRQKPHSPAGGCEDTAVLRCNNTPHSSFMAVPETAKVARMCVHVTWRCCISCQVFSSRSPSSELQASDRTPDLEGCLEPGKEEPVQALILDTHKQPLITDKYGLQLRSTAARRGVISCSSLCCSGFFSFTCWNPTEGAYFWLKHNQVSLDAPPTPQCHRQQGRDGKHRTLLLKHLPS